MTMVVAQTQALGTLDPPHQEWQDGNNDYYSHHNTAASYKPFSQAFGHNSAAPFAQAYEAGGYDDAGGYGAYGEASAYVDQGGYDDSAADSAVGSRLFARWGGAGSAPGGGGGGPANSRFLGAFGGGGSSNASNANGGDASLQHQPPQAQAFANGFSAPYMNGMPDMAGSDALGRGAGTPSDQVQRVPLAGPRRVMQ